jgi:Ni/Co efflux regulator RcnB
MLSFGKKMLLAVSLSATVLGGATAMAQPGPGNGWDQGRDRGRDDGRNNNGRGNGRDDRDNRRDNDRRDSRRDDRGPQANNWRSQDRNVRNWRNYDYNRAERGAPRYYADNYYRGGYKPVRVTRQTRIYRGNNGNFYCRRNDGTTGLIVGAALGGVLGNQVGNGDSSLLATLLGAGAGGLLGQQIDRGNVSCR